MSIPPELEDLRHTRPSVDSRTLNPGELFFALRGERDGHEFAGAAIERGAAAVVAERPLAVRGRVIVVPDTLAALQALAARVRQEWGGKLVAVTGSAGKTTTKDVIAALLGSAFPVGKTEGNFNNHIGVPLSLLRMPREPRVAVIEIGMNHAGEIRRLAAIAKPDVAVVTNVGNAHVENFASGIEGVALAKRELVEALPPDGTAVLNADDPRVVRFRDIHPGPVVTFGISPQADIHPQNTAPPASQPGSETFVVDGVEFECPLPGRHGILNVLAGLAVARVFEIPFERLREPVRGLSPGRMRGEIITRNGVTIINDCYNSNPEAARAMLDLLKSMPAHRILAVLGEMLELGSSAERLHRDLGRYAAQAGIDILVGVRGAASHMVDEARRAGMPSSSAIFVEEPVEAGNLVKGLLQSGDAVLFKASRGVALERAIARIEE